MSTDLRSKRSARLAPNGENTAMMRSRIAIQTPMRRAPPTP